MNDKTASTGFPLYGVIGVIANNAEEISLASRHQLNCIEIRADLLLDAGLSIDTLMDLIQLAKDSGLASLFTLRHPEHGGTFNGSESERVAINRQALQAGVDIVDVEWDTEAALQLLADDVPMILSYHNFKGMPDESTLNQLTDNMSAVRPRGIKVVPTAATLNDAARMLQWVEDAQDNVQRIGFAMGEAGECSRILTLAYGGPVTYATFGETVAPGQIDIDLLLKQYRVMQLNADSQVVAVSGGETFCRQTLQTLNQRFQSLSENRVAIAFDQASLDSLKDPLDQLRIVERVTE